MKIILSIILFYGFVFADCKIIDKGIYKVCFNEQLNLPISGKAITYKDKIDIVNISKRPNFYKSKDVNYLLLSQIKMPWHLGHTFAKDSDFDYSDESLLATYDMINITPMYGRINIGIWRKVETRGDILTKEFETLEQYTVVEYNSKKFPVYYNRIYKNDTFLECYRVPNHFSDFMDKKLESYRIDCNNINLDYNIFN